MPAIFLSAVVPAKFCTSALPTSSRLTARSISTSLSASPTRPPTPSSASATPSFSFRSDSELFLHRRLDVVVHPEEIRRIVLVLQLHQPVVIRSIRRARRRLTLIRQVILIGAFHEYW